MKAITAEAIDFLKTSPIGDWDVSAELSQLEYQLGQRLIYVQYPKGKVPRQYVEAAQRLVRDAWSDIDSAVSFAEALSRPMFPDFWDAHDRSGQPGARLDAYAIHFNHPDARPIYCLSWNRFFFSTPTPDTMSSTYGRTRQSKNVCQSRHRPSSSSTCGASGQAFSRTWHHRSIRLTRQAHIQFEALLAARMSCAFFAGIDAWRDLLTGLAGPFARRGRWDNCPG